MAKKIIKRPARAPTRLSSKNVPVTKELLYEVRDELSYKISSLDKKISSVDKKTDSLNDRLDSLDSKIDAVDKKVDALDSKINAVDKKVDALEMKMDSKFDHVYSEFHSLRALIEEQNANNKSVLDGYNQLYQRQERIEFTQKDQQEFLFSLKRYMESNA